MNICTYAHTCIHTHTAHAHMHTCIYTYIAHTHMYKQTYRILVPVYMVVFSFGKKGLCK